MLELRDFSVGFRRYTGLWRQSVSWCLSEVNLQVQAGELVCIIGASGAGKSLLAHGIPGLLPLNTVEQGARLWQGKPIKPEALRGDVVGLLPQSISHLDPTQSIGAQIRRAGARAGRVVEPAELLAKVELNASMARLWPHQLSGGMARRVLLALALAQNAQLLIADEPTAGLDIANRDLVLRNLRARADAGGAVLLISHDLEAAIGCSDRVVVMQEGQVCDMRAASDFMRGSVEGYAARLWNARSENGLIYA